MRDRERVCVCVCVCVCARARVIQSHLQPRQPRNPEGRRKRNHGGCLLTCVIPGRARTCAPVQHMCAVPVQARVCVYACRRDYRARCGASGVVQTMPQRTCLRGTARGRVDVCVGGGLSNTAAAAMEWAECAGEDARMKHGSAHSGGNGRGQVREPGRARIQPPLSRDTLRCVPTLQRRNVSRKSTCMPFCTPEVYMIQAGCRCARCSPAYAPAPRAAIMPGPSPRAPASACLTLPQHAAVPAAPSAPAAQPCRDPAPATAAFRPWPGRLKWVRRPVSRGFRRFNHHGEQKKIIH